MPKKHADTAAAFRERFLQASNSAVPNPHSIDVLTGRAREYVQFIQIHLIDPNPNQPRKVFRGLEPLANNIKVKGVVQPILVSRNGERYRLLAGERRWRAAQMAGLAVIPAIIKDTSSLDPFIGLIENLYREDLSPVEESLAIKRLMTEDGRLTQQEMAVILGNSQPYISQALAIAAFAEKYGDITELIQRTDREDRPLSREALKEAATMPSHKEGMAFLDRICENGSTVKQIRAAKAQSKGARLSAAHDSLLTASQFIRKLSAVKKVGEVFSTNVDRNSFLAKKDSVSREIEATKKALKESLARLEEIEQQLLQDPSSGAVN